MLKKTVFISLFIFWAAVVAMLVAGLLFYQNNKKTANISGNISASSTPAAGVVLNMTEVAKHNSANDCWMVLGGKVYDFTSYIGSHPGGADMILRHCGQDGTVDYQTKDQVRPRNHSGGAYSMLINYLIGDLNQKLSGQAVSSGVQAANSAQPAYSGDN